MPFRELRSRCKCGGQLIQDTENYEVVCNACGLVASWDDVVKPRNPPDVDFEKSLAKHIEEGDRVVRRRQKTVKKHAGGRPRKKPYMRLQTFVLKTYNAKRVRPIRLKPSSPIEEILRAMVARAFRRAMFDRYQVTGLTWKTKKGKQLYGRDYKGEFFRCEKHGVWDNGALAEFTVDLRHNAPRIRFKLICGCRKELRLRCLWCGWFVETIKSGVFQCSNPKGPHYPKRCFSFPVAEVAEVATREFGEL